MFFFHCFHSLMLLWWVSTFLASDCRARGASWLKYIRLYCGKLVSHRCGSQRSKVRVKVRMPCGWNGACSAGHRCALNARVLQDVSVSHRWELNPAHFTCHSSVFFAHLCKSSSPVSSVNSERSRIYLSLLGKGLSEERSDLSDPLERPDRSSNRCGQGPWQT